MSDIPKIQPALSPEEWTALEAMRNGTVIGIAMTGQGDEQVSLQVHWAGDWEDTYDFQVWDRDALAALALHGQPFGFTREDVDLLRWVAEHTDHATGRLADRIEALLPPE
jgi:hypothetical protein